MILKQVSIPGQELFPARSDREYNESISRSGGRHQQDFEISNRGFKLLENNWNPEQNQKKTLLDG